MATADIVLTYNNDTLSLSRVGQLLETLDQLYYWISALEDGLTTETVIPLAFQFRFPYDVEPGWEGQSIRLRSLHLGSPLTISCVTQGTAKEDEIKAEKWKEYVRKISEGNKQRKDPEESSRDAAQDYIQKINNLGISDLSKDFYRNRLIQIGRLFATLLNDVSEVVIK